MSPNISSLFPCTLKNFNGLLSSYSHLVSPYTVIGRLVYTSESPRELWKLRAVGPIPTASELMTLGWSLSDCISTRWYWCFRLREHPLRNIVLVSICGLFIPSSFWVRARKLQNLLLDLQKWWGRWQESGSLLTPNLSLAHSSSWVTLDRGGSGLGEPLLSPA